MIDAEKPKAAELARRLQERGFSLLATAATQQWFARAGIEAKPILKLHEGRPHIVDAIENGEIQLIINTPIGKLGSEDDSYLRKAAIKHGIAYVTTLAAAEATVNGIEDRLKAEPEVQSLQEYHQQL